VPVATSPQPAAATPGLVVYRFAANLYYANANRFTEEIRSILGADSPPRWLCLEAASIGDVDYSGGETLRDLHAELDERGVRLVFADVADPVRAQLDRYRLTALFGADAYYDSVDDVLAAYEKHTPGAGGAAPEPSPPGG
jgi:MFS superfamily sulfate permease-like transporter